MDPISPMLEVAREFGLYGLLATLVILAGVYAARKAGIVATGNQARIANIVLSAILYGLSGEPAAESALMAALTSIVAGLVYELLKWLGSKIPSRQA